MSSDLVDALRRQGLTDVDDSALAKSLYASDAGIYRIAPRVVVRRLGLARPQRLELRAD